MQQLIYTHLLLARASNLPTVWANVACVFLLVGGRDYWALLSLCLVATSFYTGGMYLNDWADSEFDQTHRPERPIPAGRIKRSTVLYCAIAYLGVAWITGLAFGLSTFISGTVLLGLIIWYDLQHKGNRWSPVLMGGCRACLYVWTALTVAGHLSFEIVVISCVIWGYVIGISLVARGGLQQRGGPVVAISSIAGLLMLGLWMQPVSIGMACVMLGSFAVWLFYSLRGFGATCPSVDTTVSRLLAGLVLLDLYWVVCAADIGIAEWVLFGVLFVMTLLFQIKIPAT
jgi:4-hydroxybenzoate polyprenyltransferase|tara:strand:- start:4081 stop:4938 length:858 start_codon:yes stop_codon:yes gene_type:complete